jgi:hypothetical protein
MCLEIPREISRLAGPDAAQPQPGLTILDPGYSEWVTKCLKEEKDAPKYPPGPVQLAFAEADLAKAAEAFETEQQQKSVSAAKHREAAKKKRDDDKKKKADEAAKLGEVVRTRSVGDYEKFKKSHQTVTWVAGE